ncbi:MAG: STAS domain-containing protein [Mycolicibacterium sp.]|nr:STAS domain-containing protein [Mycobacterium sp.]MCB9418029.1 STAS domain-containing protein [Mycolicibacterium sp.]
MPPLTVREELVRDAVVVRVAGDLDAASADALRAGLRSALPAARLQPARLLVVDLEEVSYFGSAGLNAMLDCRDEAAAQDVTVRLIASHPVVTRPIEVTGLGDVLPVHPTLTAALDSAGPPG